MLRILFPALLLFGFSSDSLGAADLPAAATETIEFEKQILPIFAAKCLDCHGEFLQESELRLDRKASLIRGGESGEPAILTGNSAESHLIKLVAGLEKDLVMPPDPEERLSAKQISLLRAWIDQGTVWPGPHGIVKDEKPTTDHWSFQPLAPVAVPIIEDPWIRNPIDAFILDKLREKKIEHSDAAERAVLMRRIYLDVLGLPPSPEEIETFLKEAPATATEKLIERVLHSSHYGERWARHWLDLVRFAETHGFETNRERPNAWRYRDYVIQSFNDDKPYDQFIREQIAGDTYGNVIGLGYLVAGPYDQVKSPDMNLTLMQRHNELDDMINTTGTAFLGLTIGCARCHNHKFDPITQTDYYALQAIFAGVNHAETSLPLDPARQNQLATLGKKIQSLKQQLKQYQVESSNRQLLFVDDDPALAKGNVRHLQTIAGHGKNPAGSARGEQKDAGDEDRSPNVSGGQYSWWKHKPGEPVVAYAPQRAGKFRLWLSWGVGFETHSADALYVIDRDGDPQTRTDWKQIAVVDQKQFADGADGLQGKPLWSGFYDAGTVTLESQHTILLVGGKTGTALTADVILLDPASDAESDSRKKPVFRPAVQATGNLEQFRSSFGSICTVHDPGNQLQPTVSG